MDLIDIINELQEEVPDAPADFCEVRFRRAARDFLSRTRVWRDNVLVVGADETFTYEAYTRSNKQPTEVLVLSHNGKPLDRSSRQRIAYLGPSTGKPTRYASLDKNITVHPDPGEDVSEQLEAQVVLTLPREFTTVPDELYSRYGDAMRSGALGRLMTMPARPWTAFDVGRMHLSYYAEEIERWQGKAADDGNVGVARRVRYGGY